MHENWPPSSQAKRKVDWDLWNICASLLFPFVMLLEHFWYEISSFFFCISAPSPLEQFFFCLSAFRSREVVSLLTASTLTHVNYCGVPSSADQHNPYTSSTAYFIQKCRWKCTIVSYQNESVSSKWELPFLPNPPLSYEGRREQKGSSHLVEKLSFW